MNADVEVWQDQPQWIAILEPAWQLARRLEVATEFVPDAFRGRAEAIMAAIVTGSELGRGPMWALRNLNVIKGRVGLSAEAMRALVLAAGHEIWLQDQDRDHVTLAGRRNGSDRTTTVTWTIKMATDAHLTTNPAWKDYPRAMLTARATTELCRLIFADVIAGIPTVQELDDGYPLETIGPDRTALDSPNPIRRRRSPVQVPPTAQGTASAEVDAMQDPPPARPPLPGEPGHVDRGGPDEQPPPVDLTSRRKLFAMVRAAFPGASKQTQDHHRHALTALATRDRDQPTVHFAELDDPERAALSAFLEDVRAGRLLVSSDSQGHVMASTPKRNAVMAPPEDGTEDGWTVTIHDR